MRVKRGDAFLKSAGFAITTMLGTALAKEIDLKESLGGAGVEIQEKKLDALKSKLAQEKSGLEKPKRPAKRRTELEKRRREKKPMASRPSAK